LWAVPAVTRTRLRARIGLALIGVGAVSADAGYTTSNLGEGAMMQEMISRGLRGSWQRSLFTLMTLVGGEPLIGSLISGSLPDI
jgi:hypothetical protein